MLDQDNGKDIMHWNQLKTTIIQNVVSLYNFPESFVSKQDLLTFYLANLDQFLKFDTMFPPGE